uniref:non-specific serine/threonine protein kinase n=1 Tax=Davidia involucrata TaxID=16924 RepID=A0A5B6YKA8_DAVIN
MRMRSTIYLIFWCTVLLCSSLQFCAARDAITGGRLIRDGENLISAGERFQLGFFTPDGDFNNNRYVGIWYYLKDPIIKTIVWVANRDKPLPADSTTGHFGLEKGNLKVLSENGSSYFSTDLANSTSGRTVKLLDSGNLVLSDDLSGNVLWQSFNHPTDTFLPGMKMDENLKLTSWRSRKDPGSGNFKFQQDQEAGEGHYLILNRSITYWKSGEFGDFISYTEILSTLPVLLSNFSKIPNRNGSIYSNISTPSISDYENTRLLMNSSGEIQYFRWDDHNNKGWSLKWSAPRDQCSVYNFCGNFGSCNSKNRLVCKCLPGFKPSSPDNWNYGDFSGGCTRKSSICTDQRDTTYFFNLTMMKVGKPETLFEDAKSEDDCKKECLNNCQCQAYSYYVQAETSLRSKPGCWLWTVDLINLQEEYSQGVHDLHVRILASDIFGSTARNCEPCGANMIPYPLSTGSNCGDPTYSNFRCNSSTGQVSFQTGTESYRVTSINPDTHRFVIQAIGAENCRVRTSRQLKTPFPFYVNNLCYVDTNISSADKLLQGRGELEIGWYPPPLEPTCTSSTDCKYWPDSNCSKGKCLCNANYFWNGSMLNCSQGPVIPVQSNPKQIGEFGPKGTSISLKAVVIAIIVIVAILLLCSVSYITYDRRMAARRRESRESQQGNPVLHLYDSERQVKDFIDSGQFEEDDKKGIDVPFLELESILAATNNFSDANKLGQGGFGPVYKGMFPGGQEIAIKRLSSHSGQGLEEFKNEVVLIAKLQHRNLVRLLGYCIKGDEKILLYEYMPNKSLDAFIFDRKQCLLLDWVKRFDIILGVARGLLYLHQDSRLRIIHRDLKTSNILLDEEMNPKISDFGLARIVGGKETKANTTKVVGTYGYMSPEYALEGSFSIKSDVFSFGVVVLEIISGKRNTGFYQSQQAMNLLGYAWKFWKEEKALELMDETLLESCNRSEVLKCITVGLLCVQEDPGDRPTMSTVVFMLGSETETLPNPKQPAFVARKNLSTTASSSSSKVEIHSINELTVTLEGGR